MIDFALNKYMIIINFDFFNCKNSFVTILTSNYSLAQPKGK